MLGKRHLGWNNKFDTASKRTLSFGAPSFELLLTCASFGHERLCGAPAGHSSAFPVGSMHRETARMYRRHKCTVHTLTTSILQQTANCDCDTTLFIMCIAKLYNADSAQRFIYPANVMGIEHGIDPARYKVKANTVPSSSACLQSTFLTFSSQQLLRGQTRQYQ